MKYILALILTLFVINTQAATLLKITVPDQMKINGKNIILNGMGIRKAKVLFLRVKVYVGSLYVSKKSQNAAEIISQPGPKFINMHFVRDVSKKKLIGGWKDAFNNAVKDQSKIQNQIGRFYKMMEDIDDTKEIKITFYNDKVNVNFNGKDKGDVLGAEFSKSLLSVWFINASDEGLRDGLLGKLQL